MSMAEQGAPRQNGFAQRLMRTIEVKEVALTEYRDCADASEQIGRFLDTCTSTSASIPRWAT